VFASRKRSPAEVQITLIAEKAFAWLDDPLTYPIVELRAELNAGATFTSSNAASKTLAVIAVNNLLLLKMGHSMTQL
jgi:hypothetical protein